MKKLIAILFLLATVGAPCGSEFAAEAIGKPGRPAPQDPVPEPEPER